MTKEEKVKLVTSLMKRHNRTTTLYLYNQETYGELDMIKSIAFSLKEALRIAEFAKLAAIKTE